MTFDARRRYAAIAMAAAVVGGTSPAIAQTSSLQQVSIALTGEAPGDQAGLQLATGDLDGDRVEDLVIGAYGNDHGGQFAGAVYIEYGPIRRGFSLSRADVKLFAPLAGDYAGEGPI
ncbi:MAG TPA: FG-GAP repeat protein, partial [Mycobacteriales bacterium]|nr:FG-GAP repeat protein [Mycobacteriales bacterium]